MHLQDAIGRDDLYSFAVISSCCSSLRTANARKWDFPETHSPQTTEEVSEQLRQPRCTASTAALEYSAGERRSPCVQRSRGAPARPWDWTAARMRAIPRPLAGAQSPAPCPRVLQRFPATSPRCSQPARRFPVTSVLSSVFHRFPNAGKRGVFR